MYRRGASFGILAISSATCDNSAWAESVRVNGAKGNNARLLRNSAESCSYIRITR